jgi:excisionase family DNA binding protein
MKPEEVADLFRVSVRTVGDWARSGRLASVTTPGKQVRFRREDVLALLEEAS